MSAMRSTSNNPCAKLRSVPLPTLDSRISGAIGNQYDRRLGSSCTALPFCVSSYSETRPKRYGTDSRATVSKKARTRERSYSLSIF